ncbi:MAG TPA: GNAT family N-acetyltransferase [Dehalococcoidia bacterium]
MPDMLARLYDLPDPAPGLQRIAAAGLRIRRADPWDRDAVIAFVRKNFHDVWAMEADRAFAATPISCYIGLKDAEIGGFAVYECTRRDYFGPTGVREDLRGNGLGAALLLACLSSMREMGYAYAIIGGVGPAKFYEKTVGAFVIPGSEVGIFGSLADLRGGTA